MEVGEREAGICDQHFYHGECGCPCHRAPLPVVALLRGAPHEATGKCVGVLAHRGRHGLRCPTHALVTSVSGGIIIHTTGKPRTRRRLPCADHHADERVLLLHRIVLGGPCPASATWCQVVGSINPPATRSTQSRSISSTSAPRSRWTASLKCWARASGCRTILWALNLRCRPAHPDRASTLGEIPPTAVGPSPTRRRRRALQRWGSRRPVQESSGHAGDR